MKTKRVFFSLVLILLITAGCSGDDPGANATAAPTPPQAVPVKITSATGTFFTINELGLGSNGFVALTNFTDVPASLADLYLCQGVECFELPDVVVNAGETVRIAVGDGDGHEGVVATHATLGDLRSSDGEVALYVSQELENPQEMLTYFQWGATPHDLTQIAIDAGLWVEGGYGPSSQNATRLFKDADTGLWLFEEP
jgi:hypothetical protein